MFDVVLLEMNVFDVKREIDEDFPCVILILLFFILLIFYYFIL